MFEAGEKVHWTKYGRTSIRRVEGVIVSVEGETAMVKRKSGKIEPFPTHILHKDNESGEMDVIFRAMR